MTRAVVAGLVVAAVVTELSKPEAERTWHGRVFDLVPYDFRPPTWQRIRDAYWNPHSERLFSDRVFGVGWAVNLHQARALLVDAYDRLMRGAPATAPIRMAPRREKRASDV